MPFSTFLGAAVGAAGNRVIAVLVHFLVMMLCRAIPAVWGTPGILQPSLLAMACALQQVLIHVPCPPNAALHHFKLESSFGENKLFEFPSCWGWPPGCATGVGMVVFCCVLSDFCVPQTCNLWESQRVRFHVPLTAWGEGKGTAQAGSWCLSHWSM